MAHLWLAQRKNLHQAVMQTKIRHIIRQNIFKFLQLYKNEAETLHIEEQSLAPVTLFGGRICGAAVSCAHPPVHATHPTPHVFVSPSHQQDEFPEVLKWRRKPSLPAVSSSLPDLLGNSSPSLAADTPFPTHTHTGRPAHVSLNH